MLFKKFLGKRSSRELKMDTPSVPEEMVQHIQDGDLRLRNQFIADYQPMNSASPLLPLMKLSINSLPPWANRF
jgi:hypothetical protein